MADAGVKGTVTLLEPARAERSIGRRAAETRATVPDLELAVTVEMDRCLALAHPTAALLVRACALALRDSPRANAAYRDGRFELYSRVNVGVLMALNGTLVAPTVFDADRKSPSVLAGELAALRERADELTAPELTGATFTLSDLGSLGIDRGAPLLIGSQAAAVAAGSIRNVPVVRDGAIVPGHVMELTLACDHRILFGGQAAEFLIRIKQLLEEGSL